MKRSFPLLTLLMALISGCASQPMQPPTTNILFVGNSLTYVGNLPAVLITLASANGQSVSTEMIANAGATLSERVADGSVEKAMATQHYDYVVLQERGGDVLCLERQTLDDPACASGPAHQALAGSAAAHSARVVLLGTYQFKPAISLALQASEQAMSVQIGALYLPVSERLRCLRTQHPERSWLADDGVHPGKDTTLIEAIWLYHALFKQWPAASTFEVPQQGSSTEAQRYTLSEVAVLIALAKER